MKLSSIERMTILGILPANGDFTTLKIITDLQAEVGFSEADHKILKIRPREDGQEGVMWNLGLPDKECDVGPKAEGILVDALKKLDTEKKLDVQTFPLYKRFVIGGN